VALTDVVGGREGFGQDQELEEEAGGGDEDRQSVAAHLVRNRSAAPVAAPTPSTKRLLPRLFLSFLAPSSPAASAARCTTTARQPPAGEQKSYRLPESSAAVGILDREGLGKVSEGNESLAFCLLDISFD
jgi:hypothetical protein